MNDLDMTELRLSTFPYYERARQLSQELQLSGKSGPVNWLIGGYYFDEHIFEGLQATRNLLVVGGSDRLTNGYIAQGDTQTETSAVFGQADIALTSRLKLILGARYGRERIDISDTFQLDFVRSYTPNAPIIPLPGFPRSDSTTNNAFTPKGGIEYQLNDQTMFYATASKGFKSGRFNLGIKVPAFRPESIWSYEAGLKLTTTDRKLRANFSGFYYDYSNLQVTKIVTTQALTENAASATLYGGELELTVLPVAGVQIDGSIAYLHSAYTEFSSLDPVRPQLGVLDLKGNQLIQAPKLTANLGVQYEHPVRNGSLTLRGELNYMSRIYFTAVNVDSVSQGANAKYNAFLTWAGTGDHWNASLFVRNITDKITHTSGLVSSQTYGAPINGSISPPRTRSAWATSSDVAQARPRWNLIYRGCPIEPKKRLLRLASIHGELA